MTDIQKYTIQNPLTVAEHFAKSGLFEDAKDMSKALVKILAGRELGLPDMASMTGIHIIKGKPVLGANLIASLIKSSIRFDYKVIEMNDKVCSIDFYERAPGLLLSSDWQKVGNSTFTVEDAQKAGTQNMSKFPKNMLFARAISNGAKWFCPSVFNGQTVYTEGELAAPQIVEVIDDNPIEDILDRSISDAQRSRLFAIAKGKDRTYPAWMDAQIKDYLASLGINSSKEIPVSMYEDICKVLEGAPFYIDAPGQVKLEEVS